MSQTFPECLNTALVQSGKTLAQVEAELHAKGFRINRSTLNRWCNGQTSPRRDKLALLRYLPDLLEMRPALRSVFNRIVNQMAGGHINVGEPAENLSSRQNYLGGPVVYFTGRSPELARLKEAVRKRQTVLITGLGGVGKTALARKLLEEMTGEFTYGCDALVVEANQLPAAVMEQVARRLGVPLSAVTVNQDFDLAMRELKSWTDNIDMLFLLDDVKESAQVQHMVSGLKDITWVITSRRKLFLASDAVEVGLAPPPTGEAVSMLHYYSNLRERPYNLSTARQIVIRLGSLPIAIKAAGGLVQTGRLASLESLLGWLKEQGLDGVRLEDWELADFLAGLLEMVEPDGRDLFALCGVFPSSQVDLEAFSALAKELGLPMKSLGQLANLSLVEWQVQENQFQMHPLIHEYAGRYLKRHNRQVEMCLTFAAYYANFAKRYYRQDQQLESELSQLNEAARIACDQGNWLLLKPLWQAISDFLWRKSDWAKYRQFDSKCLEVAREAGERQMESKILAELGWVSMEEGKWQEAEKCFQKAQQIVDDLTSTQQSVRLRRYRARLFTEQGQLEKGAALLAEAEHLVERTSEIVGWPQSSRDRSLALLCHAYAGLALAAGDYKEALRKEQKAIAFCEQTDCRSYRPMFDLRLGDIYYLSSDLERAGNIWQQIIRHGSHHQPEQRIIAAAFLRMAQLAAYRKNHERALGWAYRAEQIYLVSGLAEKARKARKLAGSLEQLMADPPDTWPAFDLWD